MSGLIHGVSGEAGLIKRERLLENVSRKADAGGRVHRAQRQRARSIGRSKQRLCQYSENDVALRPRRPLQQADSAFGQDIEAWLLHHRRRRGAVEALDPGCRQISLLEHAKVR